MVVEPGPFRTNFRVSHVRDSGQKIPDYAQIKEVHDRLAADPFGQKGDPEKAAKVIVEMIEKEDYPKTILLGKGTVDQGTAILRDEIREIEKWKEAGEAVSFDDPLF